MKSFPPRVGLRILLLALCVGAGLVVGFVGQYLADSAAWFLAVPVFVAAGWFAVADPTACLPSPMDGTRPPRKS